MMLEQGQCIVIDNLVDYETMKTAHIHFRDNYVYHYGNKSGNPLDNIFWISTQDKFGNKIDDDQIQLLLLRKVLKEMNAEMTDVEDIYLNAQTYGLDGSLHIDRVINDEVFNKQLWTILYMTNDENEKRMGNFQFGDDEIEYKGGRFVIFDSLSLHRGLAPTIKNDLRISLAWKNVTLNFLDND